MRGREQLSRELDALLRERGSKVEDQNCRVAAEVIRWTREVGHGDVRLSALGHMLAPKFRVDSVVTVGGDENENR